MGYVNNPKYYQFHWIISRPVKKCFILKQLIMIVKQGSIHLEVIESNHATIAFRLLNLVSLHVHLWHWGQVSILFDMNHLSKENISVIRRHPPHLSFDNELKSNNAGWVLVSSKKPHKSKCLSLAFLKGSDVSEIPFKV